MANRVGQQLGNYHLVKLLGEGGFAQVYLGEHVHLGTEAAVKVLTTKLTEEGVALFRKEARTIISLEHPNIIRVLDFGMEDRIPFIVMSYAPKGTLRQRHPKGTCLPLDTIVYYAKQVADALQYAHDQRLIHRDVKPDNMLIGRNNQVLLSDFGIAVVAHSTHSLNTLDGSGTLYYMAPEQIQGRPRIASDQYALGIVVYEWLSGTRPFNGTATEIGIQHLLASPPSLREKLPTLSPAVEEVVFRALAKDYKQRFASVKAFATALEQASQQIQPVPLILPRTIHPASPLPSQPPEASIISQNSPQVEIFSAEPSITTDNSAIASHRKSLSRERVILLVALVLLFVIASTSVLYTLRAQIMPPAKADLTATADAAMNAYDAGVEANGIMFGFDSQHTHLNPYERILGSSNVSRLALDWTGSTGGTCCRGELVSSPVVAYGIVYVGSFEGKLYAFNASGCGSSSCPPLWTASTGNIIYPALAIAKDVVYAGSFDHKLYAFNASGCGSPSCPPLWTATVKNTIISSPTIAQGMIYVGSDDYNFYAFNASGCGSSSCSPVWKASTGNYVESSPAVANDVVYVGSLDHKLYAFNASGCGKPVCPPLWMATASKRIRSSPAVVNNVVYVGSDDGKLYAFNASGCGNPSCPPLWTASTGGIIISSPTIANDVVYVGSLDHKLYAFNASGCGSFSCPPLWTFTTKASIHASPAVANGIVYIMSYDSILYAFHLPYVEQV